MEDWLKSALAGVSIDATLFESFKGVKCKTCAGASSLSSASLSLRALRAEERCVVINGFAAEITTGLRLFTLFSNSALIAELKVGRSLAGLFGLTGDTNLFEKVVFIAETLRVIFEEIDPGVITLRLILIGEAVFIMTGTFEAEWINDWGVSGRFEWIANFNGVDKQGLRGDDCIGVCFSILRQEFNSTSLASRTALVSIARESINSSISAFSSSETGNGDWNLLNEGEHNAASSSLDGITRVVFSPN